ncbi:helix-turn-helix domain-containing protein [Mycetocola spongiae]|uniref:helix-turn-helix domain-containing protein n=1 Tax=Mycetocola spongiae TaxID=2859226 RepID=UPI001CF3674A|nr:helix-turn-helix domain-containing protein [Mycetocola spongiae]UCR89261.1 helix-turn-helix domain-containing protein [Mycetocola spongiae]
MDSIERLNAAADALARALVERDAAILAAHAAGVPVAQIAREIRMSRMQVHRIITAE